MAVSSINSYLLETKGLKIKARADMKKLAQHISLCMIV
jgi:hypothetical protein